MHVPPLPRGLALAAAAGLCALSGACGPGWGPPPEPSTSCASDAPPPADEAAALFLSDPAGGAAPIAPGEVLPLEYGPQGGQHVTVGVRHHTDEAGVWVYTLGFEQDPAGPDAPTDALVLKGSNTLAVQACGSGWTETLTPVFIGSLRGEVPPEDDDGPDVAGVLRVVATNKGSGARLSAQVEVTIAL